MCGRGDYDQFLLYSLPDEAAERDLAARAPHDVARVGIEASVREVFDRVRQTGHSRLPVELPDGSLRGLVLYADLQGRSEGDGIRDRVRDHLLADLAANRGGRRNST